MATGAGKEQFFYQTEGFSGKAGLRHVPNVFASRRPGISGWDGKGSISRLPMLELPNADMICEQPSFLNVFKQRNNRANRDRLLLRLGCKVQQFLFKN